MRKAKQQITVYNRIAFFLSLFGFIGELRSGESQTFFIVLRKKQRNTL